MSEISCRERAGILEMKNEGIDDILVTSYRDPDLDGVASAVAYAEFLNKTGNSAVAGLLGTPTDEATWVAGRFGIKIPIVPFAAEYEKVAIVDASDANWLSTGLDPKRVIEVIDHRPVYDKSLFPNAKFQIEAVGAAATLVAEKFRAADTPISKNSAALLCAAIISNTLNFRAGVTTERDRAAAARLNGIAELPETFAREMFTAKSDVSGEKLAAKMGREYATFEFSGRKILFCQLEVVGAQELAAVRRGDILAQLQKLKAELKQDVALLSVVDLEEDVNVFVVEDKEAQEILNKTVGVWFHGNVAVRPGLLMRKQIVALFRDYLEHHGT